jgi:outer membrane protein OmpA-like peptidoglycan-associated protein
MSRGHVGHRETSLWERAALAAPHGARVAVLMIVASVMAAPRIARAQWRFHLNGGVTLPMAHPQLNEFGLGAGGGLAVEWEPHPLVGLLARVEGLAVSRDPGPLPQGVLQPGTGTLEDLVIGARLHALRSPLGSRASDGIWFEVTGGGGITGAEIRPLVAGRAGVSFGIDRIAIGPWISYTRVFDIGPSVLPGDAQLVVAGLELTYAIPPRVRARLVVPAVVFAPPVPNRCPPHERVTTGDFDHDGCPDGDRDGDTIADVRDACPDQAEDFDGFEDSDGCYDADNDHDGIHDLNDACPDQPETVNGVNDEDGCPDSAPVQMVRGRIEMSADIEFAFNSARILPQSLPMIAAIAAVFRAHPDYGTVFIEGHADEIGPLVYNYNMSYQRARSVVDAMVALGLPRARLVPLGFGNTAPIDPRRTNEARARNRRVEFVTGGHRSTGRARTAHGYIQIHDQETP